MTEPDITTVSQKGQVVIPQAIRNKLGLKPKTKLLVYGYQDTIVLKKLYVPDLKEEWERIKRIIEERNRKYGRLTEEEVRREIEAARKSKKR
ncbi:MAG: AbrB/MazE/SpoVT family DNA-binding domain-containing protein [Thermoproteota archaeon]|uniref:AbrB/MazE/SpoVT family DNA-binding domain-containing protein n=1 Tax=Thermofilum sp. TaxID=1961369 RepID=UPI003165C944|nr:AbrB/MazE/SpoVT family DNA-binding domain-containing protein [Candidatus Brockarchaeota archaeon]